MDQVGRCARLPTLRKGGYEESLESKSVLRSEDKPNQAKDSRGSAKHQQSSI